MSALDWCRDVSALLLDDNAFARMVSQRILGNLGIGTIIEASNGMFAIDLLKQDDTTIDIVFCDIMMPDMDGIEFLRHAETMANKPAIVFVSGADMSLLSTVENTARARNFEVLGSITKPFTLDAAQAALAKFAKFRSTSTVERRNYADVTAEDLQAALAGDQFRVQFQPKISLSDDVLVGFESLARWHHPDRGPIPPDVFIPAAEKEGLIGEVTERTVALTLKHCAAWARAGLHKKVSINLSAFMLVDTDLPNRLLEECLECEVHPEQVILEITESGLFKDMANTLEILARLHIKGFALSIDDFGTGYSSMQQLSRVPFKEMKIDKAFVNGASANRTARAILESSVDLGRKLGLSVVAEGAENQDDCDTLRKAGVDIVQGYFISKPMEADRVLSWSEEWARASGQG